MNIYELKQRTNILSQLLEIWEDSVRATHHFLSDAEVNQIKKYVPQALTGVKHLIVAENEIGIPVAFMGNTRPPLGNAVHFFKRKRKRNRKAAIKIWN